MFNPNPNFNPWQANQPSFPGQNQRHQAPIIVDSGSDDSDDQQPYNRTNQDPSPGLGSGLGPRQPTLSPTYTPRPVEQEKRIRSRLREERHAALCVLMDRELLTVQALAAQETIPQTRRRFLSNLLSPSDPATAAAIRADRFTIQRPASSAVSANTEPMVVSRSVVDVCESDDSGWYKPVPAAEENLSERGSASPLSSGKVRSRGRETPERRVKGRVSSGRQQQQQQTRERRRRWSGAERQDFGAGASF
ncbi:hypothetical protein BDV18DRAFT_164916 [Aspergillus unguis]